MDIDPQTYALMASLAVAGWLAGRNRLLARTMRTMVATYEGLLIALRTEINRLESKIKSLESFRSASTRTRRQ